MTTFDVITIFPNSIKGYLEESIIGRAEKNKLIKIRLHDLRGFSESKHKKVDDRPYGGGPGMVLMLQPLVSAMDRVAKALGASAKKSETEVVVFAAGGKQFDQKTADLWARRRKHLIFVCGHYEGIDARLVPILKKSGWKVSEISIGPYVLTGGEVPAMAVIDAVSRRLPGVLGKGESIEEMRHGVGVPVFTRPEVFTLRGKKYLVPKELLSGNHRAIEKWRLEHKAK